MSIKLGLCGDIMLGRSFTRIFEEFPHEMKDVWGNTLSIFNNIDLLIGNLETTITSSEDKWPGKKFNYKMNPKYSQTLMYPRFTYLSIANNHILDFKEAGLRDTQANLSKLGILYGGVGIEIEAMKPTIVDIPILSNDQKLNKIIIFSASDHYHYWAATPTKAGIFYLDYDDSASVEKAISLFKSYKRTYPDSFIILSYHWGSNWESQIPQWKRSLSTRLFDSGIDLIHGHSAHHVESGETINGKVVFYSLGDLIDDYAIDEVYRNDIGMIVTLDIDLENGMIEPESIQMVLTQNTHNDGKFQVNTILKNETNN